MTSSDNRPKDSAPAVAEKIVQLEQRIEHLESLLAYQDKLYADLSAVMAEQQELLDTITPHLRDLSQKVRTLEDASATPPSEKPPHY
jgi:SlyX protein